MRTCPRQFLSFPKRGAATTDYPQSDYPVTIDQIARPLGLDGQYDSSVYEQLVELRKTATALVEKHTQRAFIQGAWTLTLDDFYDEIELRVCPVDSVTSISYVDTAGATQTLSTSIYQTDLISEPARILEAFGQVWPQTKTGTMNVVTVTFVAGYDSVALIPIAAKEAIKRAAYLMFNGCELDCLYWSLIETLKWAGDV